jgi:hypothetical protein
MSADADGMTARERLTRQLRNPGLVGLDEFEASELIAAFEYELAEEIRATRDDMAAAGIESEFIDGMSYAANGIDPQGHEGVRLNEKPAT